MSNCAFCGEPGSHAVLCVRTCAELKALREDNERLRAALASAWRKIRKISRAAELAADSIQDALE